MSPPTPHLSRAQLEELARLVRVGISVIDLVDPDDPDTWVIVFNNPAASEASGTDVESQLGHRFLEAFPAVRNTPFIGWYQQVLREQREIELPEVSYGDERIPESAFRVWLSPLPGRAVLGQYVNVTQQRIAEGRLRALNASLEQTVAQRTAELARSRRTLREVANAAAHDLQTPVQHLLTLTDLMRRGEPKPALLERIEQLRAGAEGMFATVNALLRYTTADDQLDRQLCTVREVVETAAEATRPWPEGAQVDLQIETEKLWVDLQAFNTIVFQMLDNALRFTAPGAPPEVTVKVWPSGRDAKLSVSDRGIGIAREHHSSVFEAFRRLNRASEYPGLGLGLALCRIAVEAHEGTLELESVPGEGCTFTVTLPRAVPAGDPA